MTIDLHRYAIIVPTPLPGGYRLGVIMDAQGVTRLDLLSRDTPLHRGGKPFERQVEDRLAHYFQNPTAIEDIPLHPTGTPYQIRVWQALRQIPVGTTSRYGELAGTLATSPRAVAAACRANPIPILIPCHRVVAKEGLGGYMGATTGEAVMIKQWLLHHEGAR